MIQQMIMIVVVAMKIVVVKTMAMVATVTVPKKDGKVQMCMDFQDLNRASPKDNFLYRTSMSL